MKVKIVGWHNKLASCSVQLSSRQCDNCVGSCGLFSVSTASCSNELWVNSCTRKFANGDTAELVVSSSAITLAAMIVFVIPVAFLLIPVSVATYLELSESLLFTVAAMGLTAGLSVSVLYGMQLDWSKLFDLQLKSVENGSER